MSKAWDRFLLGIMAIGYLVLSLFLLVTAIGWTRPFYLLENYLLYKTNPWIIGIVGAMLFILSLTQVITMFRVKPPRVSTIHETSLGIIHITLPALENLVLKAAQSVQGIKEVRAHLRSIPEGVAIQLTVQVMPDINIPRVSEDVQKMVKEYLQKTAGISVKEIRLVVNRINWETKTRVE